MSPTEASQRESLAGVSLRRSNLRPVDPFALARIRRRLQKALGAPWLHGEVARRMAERLALIKSRPGLVVDWQSHLGGGQKALREAYPSARVIRVEMPADRATPERPQRGWMSLGQAVRGLLRSGDEVVDIQDLEPGQAGLVWANMVLHGHGDPSALFSAWHRALSVEGFLMFSTFGPGTLPELRALYARAGWGIPMAPLVDMHDLGDMLIEAGFADPVMDQEQMVLTWPDASAALSELRGLGGNAEAQRHPGCRTPRWRQRLEQALNALAAQRPDGRVALTFEIAYGHAFKPVPRLSLAPQTHVDMDQMRQMLSVRQGRRG